MNINNKDKLSYINILYVIGMIFVVMGHATLNYLGNWGPINLIASPISVSINRYIYSFHMPLFFFISGYVFRYNIKNGNYQTFNILLNKKFNRLIVPYLLVGLFYLIPFKFIFGYINLNEIPKAILNIIIGRNVSQLWYLLCLFNIFILYYFIKDYINKNIDNQLIIFLSVLVMIGVNALNLVIPDIFQLKAVTTYILFFHLGYITYKNKYITFILNKNSIIIYICHIGFYLLSIFIKIPGGSFINKIIGCYGYLHLAYYLSNKYKFNNYKIFNIMNKYNFEIYLFHQQIILVLLQSYKFRSMNPIVVVLLTFILSIVTSILIAIFINFITLNIARE